MMGADNTFGETSFNPEKRAVLKRVYTDKQVTKSAYDRLLSSGFFFEFYPDLSGDWTKDESKINKMYTGPWSDPNKGLNARVGKKFAAQPAQPKRNTIECIYDYAGGCRPNDCLWPNCTCKYAPSINIGVL